MVAYADRPFGLRRDGGLRRLAAWLHRHDAIRASLPLAPGERLLTVARDDDGEQVVATDRALYVGGHVRLGWEQIGTTRWCDDKLVLTGLVPGVVVRIRSQAALGALIEERVRWTTLLVRRVRLDGHGEARVLVRRQPGTDQLLWLVGLEDGVSGESPAVQASVDAAIARLRADIR